MLAVAEQKLETGMQAREQGSVLQCHHQLNQRSAQRLGIGQQKPRFQRICERAANRCMVSCYVVTGSVRMASLRFSRSFAGARFSDGKLRMAVDGLS